MLTRVNARGEMLFGGGVANNKCMRSLLKKALKREVVVPDQPQIVTALGCALFRANK
jgi:activator of 2-hydroxyglutaryl-CoA dehydratase